MAGAQQQPHICDENAGFDDIGQKFIDKYEIPVEFQISCLGCCLAYLRVDREYTIMDGEHDRVYFMQQDRYPDVQCIVRKPAKLP